MNTLKERFAFARTYRGYTQVALAEAIGVTRGVISNIEYGKTEPPPIVVNAICQTLVINREWLLHGTGPMEPENEQSATLKELREILERLPESLRLVLLDTARSMDRHLSPAKEPVQRPEQSGPRRVDDIIGDIETRKKVDKFLNRGK